MNGSSRGRWIWRRTPATAEEDSVDPDAVAIFYSSSGSERKKRAATMLADVVLGGRDVAVRAGEGDHGDGGLGSSRGRRSGMGGRGKWG